MASDGVERCTTHDGADYSTARRPPRHSRSLQEQWGFSVRPPMRCSLPLTVAALHPRSNMTVPKKISYCAIDLVPMSGPVAYGTGIIGIVSYRPRRLAMEPPQIRNSSRLCVTCRNGAV